MANGSSDPLSTGMFKSARQGYSNSPTGYDPYATSAGSQFQAMNYDPYRQASANASQSGAYNQMASQQASLSQAGGMSGADRMKLFNEFNRQKILGQLGSDTKYDAMGSKNQLETGVRNAERGMDVQGLNIGAGNEASKFNADASFRKAGNLYGAAMSERDLQRQLAASGIIGAAQMKDPEKNFLDRLYDVSPLHWLERAF